jgi:uncharacterized membrane protein
METQAVTPKLEDNARAEAALSWQWAAFSAIILAACGHLLIKQGLMSALHSAPASGVVAKILHYLLHSAVPAGLAIYGVGTLLWIRAVASRNISFLYPLTALNYVIVSIGGKLFFKEAISAGRWTGIAIVVAGVALLQFSMKEDQP